MRLDLLGDAAHGYGRRLPRWHLDPAHQRRYCLPSECFRGVLGRFDSLRNLAYANALQIGKTSSLVLTLSGVLKDILLVLASMFLFGDPVSLLQAFGYTIALAGLIYYKLGADKIKEHLSQANMKWAEFGANRPALRKIIVFGILLVTMFVLLGGLAPRIAPESTDKVYNGIGNLLGEKGV
jgi:hypothetical protein